MPNGQCARSCQEGGFNLLIDAFGNEKCVETCPAGFGPDGFSFNLC